jgi:hypothetical protein
MWRSLLAVLAAIAAATLVAVGGDALLMRLAPHWFGPNGEALSGAGSTAGLACTVAAAALGGWIAAALAPSRPVGHALVFGIAMLTMSIVPTASLWNTAPLWYHAATLALVVPAAWLGGYARIPRRARRGTDPTAN